MDIIYKLIPSMIVIGLICVGILIWAVKKGQYDDLEGDGQRLLLDEDEEKVKGSTGGEKRKQVGKNFPDADD